MSMINFVKKNQKVLILGDFNSRTLQLCDFVKTDSFICEAYGNQELERENSEILKCFNDCNMPLMRQNEAQTSNPHGKQMIEFCKNNNIFILNGRYGPDSANLTCKSSSTIDYALCTASTFNMILGFHILQFDALFSDAHCPIAITINTQVEKNGFEIAN